MKKNLAKLGVLSLSLVAALAMLIANNANAQQTGDVTLTINSGTSVCVYGTSLDLGTTGVRPDFGAFTLSSGFNTSAGSTTWSCTDFAGTTGGWDLTIISSNLTNETANVIASGNVFITHDAPTMTNGSCTVGGAAAAKVAINASHTIIAKAASTQKTVCTIDTANVSLAVDVPANQAPGRYAGTLTITVPTFY
ncbi:TPA: hypothetical protein DEP21_05360 [Patescibacteria group bacterium]|nr:hypothetical protein [Candidatus Gracilibacteria bacterium]